MKNQDLLQACKKEDEESGKKTLALLGVCMCVIMHPVHICGSSFQLDPRSRLFKNYRPWLLIKSHLKSLKVSLILIQFAFLNREHCLKGLIN